MENLSKEQIFDKLMNALLTEEMPSLKGRGKSYCNKKAIVKDY